MGGRYGNEEALGFLNAGRIQSVAHVFEDTPTSGYRDPPPAYRVRRGLVTAPDTIEAALARSGGQAVILSPARAGAREAYDTLE